MRHVDTNLCLDRGEGAAGSEVGRNTNITSSEGVETHFLKNFAFDFNIFSFLFTEAKTCDQSDRQIWSFEFYTDGKQDWKPF